MKKISLILLAAAALLAGAACEKIEGGEGGGSKPKPGVRVKELNGTEIAEESNMIGIVKDINGNPLAGIPVTDGYNYVVTDENGVYQMEGSRYARKAYLSIPAEYEIPLDETNHLPCFFSPGTIVRANQNRWDFTLTPLKKKEDKVTLVMVSDPQCQTEAQVQRYKDETIPNIQTTLSSMADQFPNPYAFTLGDITFDSTNLWPSMKSSMSNMKVGSNYLPFFQCIGNHDHTSTEATDFAATANFFENFGPTDYSLNRGNCHIIVMDDIICTSVKTNSSPNKATWSYDGGFTAGQFKWLQQDLALVPDKDKKCVVLCLHIPFRGGSSSGGANVNKSGAYYTEVLKALTAFKEAHVMIGHTHFPHNYIHGSYVCKSGRPVYEHVHGAACGSWWSCNMNCDGCPNGFYLYEVDCNEGTITDWTAKYTKNDINYQFRVYDGNQIYTGSKGYQYKWTTVTNGGAGAYNVGGTGNYFAKGNAALAGAFVVACWNDDPKNWKIEFWQDGTLKGNFVRLADGATTDVCICSYYYNELGKNSDSYNKSTCSHWWYYVPASKEPVSEKNWEIRATLTIPGSNKQHTYSCTALTTDYAGF